MTTGNNEREKQAYHQSLADIIGILWEFHKLRVRLGNIPFALDPFTESKYHPQERISFLRLKGYSDKQQPVIKDLEMSVFTSLMTSWYQFLDALGLKDVPNPGRVEIPRRAQRFVDPFVVALINKADTEREKILGVHVEKEIGTIGVMYVGIDTATEVTTWLSAIFGEDFNPNYPILMSKVRLKDNNEANSKIGLNKKKDGEPLVSSYELLHPTEGINREELKRYGLGKAVGCPASMKVSRETRDFLSARGVNVQRTMLENFALMLHNEFNATVRDWFNKLTPKQKEQYVDIEQRHIIQGEVWSAVKLQDSEQINNCPVSKERL